MAAATAIMRQLLPSFGDLIEGDTDYGKVDKLAVYDLELLDQNGKAITEFTGKIKVKLAIPAGMSGNLHVLWYDDATGKIVDMEAAVEDGYLVFETHTLQLLCGCTDRSQNQSSLDREQYLVDGHTDRA